MSTKVEKLENSQVSFEFSITAEEFEAALEAAYKKNVGKMKVQGFRPGKAPRAMIEKMYGEGVFYDDAINLALPDAYDKTVTDAGISPVDRPDIDIKELDRATGVIFTAKVTVKPEFTLGTYKGVSAEKPSADVSVDDVAAELEKLQQRGARQVSVDDRTVENGDTANIDFEGFVDDVAFEGGKGEGFDLKIGSGQFIPGFEEQLIGASIGADVDVNVSFPEEYHAENLAGKPALFKVKVNSIQATELPELDDEFAKDVSDFETLDALKADITAKIGEQKEKSAKAELENNILETISKDTEIEIPQCMIESQTDNLMRDFEMRMQYQGMNLEMYTQFSGTTVEELRGQMSEQAAANVKTSLILEAIGKAEDIKPTDERIEEEYQKLSEAYKMDVEELKKRIPQEDIAENLASSLVVDFLVENAKIKEAK